jgi:hypothetical protein
MALLLERWEKNGKTQRDTENPKTHVYTSFIGEQNVDLGGGKFAPYIVDKPGRRIQFADCELRLTVSGLEFWRAGVKLNTLTFHPEIFSGAWQRKTALIGALSWVEEEDSVTISYTLTTADAKATISLTAGRGFHAKFSLKAEAVAESELRIVSEFAELGNRPVLKIGNTVIGDAPWIDFGTSRWSWRLAEQDKHENLTDTVTKLGLLHKTYAQGEIQTLSPDSWGPTTAASRGYQFSTSWYTDSSLVGNLSGAPLHAGFSFLYNGATILKTATINSVYFAAINGSGATVKIAVRMQSGNWAAFDVDNLPSGASWANARATTETVFVYGTHYFGLGEAREIDLAADLAITIDADAGDQLENGDYVNICLWSDEDTSGDYTNFEGDTPTLTITWTPAGGGETIRSYALDAFLKDAFIAGTATSFIIDAFLGLRFITGGVTTFYKVLDGILSAIGSALKYTQVNRAGVLVFSGIAKKWSRILRAGISTFSGVLARAKLSIKALAGAFAFSGLVAKYSQVRRAGTFGMIGTARKYSQVRRLGILALAGVAKKSTQVLRAGVLAFSGIAKKNPRILRAGVLALSGFVGHAKFSIKALAGALAFAGSAIGIKITAYAVAVGGVLAFSGTVGKFTRKIFQGILAFVGYLQSIFRGIPKEQIYGFSLATAAIEGKSLATPAITGISQAMTQVAAGSAATPAVAGTSQATPAVAGESLVDQE